MINKKLKFPQLTLNSSVTALRLSCQISLTEVMFLRILILVTLLTGQHLFDSVLCLDEGGNVFSLKNSNLRLRNTLPCIIGTRYRTRRCERGDKRRFRKKHQVVVTNVYKTNVTVEWCLSRIVCEWIHAGENFQCDESFERWDIFSQIRVIYC